MPHRPRAPAGVRLPHGSAAAGVRPDYASALPLPHARDAASPSYKAAPLSRPALPRIRAAAAARAQSEPPPPLWFAAAACCCRCYRRRRRTRSTSPSLAPSPDSPEPPPAARCSPSRRRFSPPKPPSRPNRYNPDPAFFSFRFFFLVRFSFFS